MAIALPGLPGWIDWVCGATAALAAITDYRTGKIYNWLTLPVLVFGLTMALVCGALGLSVAGIGVAAIVFVPLFALGITGGGDVKLMLALGSVLGAAKTWELSYGAFIVTAMGGVVLLVMRGRVKIFFKEVMLFFRSLVVRGLEIHWPKLSRDIQAPFGVAILVSFVALALRHRGGT